MGIPGPGFVVSEAPGFLNQDPKSPPNGSALKTHRAKNKEREKEDLTGGTLAVTQHNDNKNRGPQACFDGTVTPLPLLRHLQAMA
ncbi:hypothetical protein GE21DRAFT_3092 [Neurospora crassa]|uniref:Uncharacterized protein n=2 Tax=Neurospora crassa TaxID=5141 RepID=Q1K8X8_NEUCR|nr:hypothetical protein NCU06797 [Neurospora crassa OR74A]EAA34402.1 hypothetical protein NCU06797 [Neurospora crassa OR74A]KHE87634.1 hypothetical protein GE21DRAFT_3092 [Neurospora crassa]CAB91729.2 hypothetical protein [Neurospora crassa]|eukprot:XP_963638.1 hypothetical protein NCU06797 [Neurospora crassa OR74A]